MKNKKSKGAFVQLNDGTWMIDTKIKINNQYRHFTKKGYRILADAKDDFENAKQQFIEKHSLHNSANLFTELINEYNQYRSAIIRISTLDYDNSIINSYILPFFSHFKTQKAFDLTNINTWYLTLLKRDDVSNARKSKVISKMKDISDYAYMHHYINLIQKQDCDCTLRQIKYQKQHIVERIIWTDEERDRFLNLYPNGSDKRIMYEMFCFLGARIGEFLGLTAKSFDYENRTISIFQQAKFVKGKTMQICNDLKNETSYRKIKLPQIYAEDLEEYIKTHNLKLDDVLFTNLKTHDRPMARTSFARILKEDCVKANVRPINPHAIRHMISVKLASIAKTTFELEQASKRMGHTPSVFMNVYANHSGEDIEDKFNKTLFA